MDAVLQFFRDFGQALASGEGTPLGFWSYLALMGLVLVEGPIATLLGAAAASAGLMNPAGVFAASSVGNLTADLLWYSLGYLGRTEWLSRHGSWFGLRQVHIEKLTGDMQRHARKLLVIAKLTVSLAVPVLIATGVARVPWRRWFGAVFLAEMAWTGLLVFAGYHFARSLRQLEAWLQVIAIVAFSLFVVLIARYAFRLVQQWSDFPRMEEE
jgi:membrane protein DedA with SNARE-associated domain